MTRNDVKIGRIRSIDALRAVVLFGILLVHLVEAFGFNRLEISTRVGGYISEAILLLLKNRCAAVFSVLFGVSFYLILRNPNYSSRKFVWRCVVLIVIGIFDKVFYTYDALMWYGIWGIALVCFRQLSTKKLWLSYILLYIINLLISYYADLRTLLFESYSPPYIRYASTNTLIDVLSYPLYNSILDYIKAVIGSPLWVLCNFLLGYCIARSGIIDDIKSYSKFKWFLVFLSLYLLLWAASSKLGLRWMISLSRLCGSVCYAIAFLWIYYKKSNLFSFLEPYGKLGLTNYAFQGIVGVTLCAVFFKPYSLSFEWFLLVMLTFYAFQVVFSFLWLKRFRYGPMEYLWRCATEKKIISNKSLKREVTTTN